MKRVWLNLEILHNIDENVIICKTRGCTGCIKKVKRPRWLSDFLISAIIDSEDIDYSKRARSIYLWEELERTHETTF